MYLWLILQSEQSVAVFVPQQEDNLENQEIGNPNKMWSHAVLILLSTQYCRHGPYHVSVATLQTTSSYSASD